jgi:hypothetical protein
MKSLFALGILVTLSAQAQVQTQEYEYRVFNIPRFVVVESQEDFIRRWDSKRAPPRPVQVWAQPKPITLPSTNQTGPLPGQTEEQRRRMESLSR